MSVDIDIDKTCSHDNTTCMCCVLAVTSYGESESLCENITPTTVTSKCTVYNYVIYITQNEIL